MDEITLDDKIYVSSKQAAKITGYAKDYVGQLCREGRVEARLVGRNWYVLESSIRDHRFGSDEKVANAAENRDNLKENEEKIPTWAPASYTPEAPSEEIPLVISYPEAPKVNILEGRNPSAPVVQPEIDQVSSKVVKEMQSAWHDWFVKTNELSVSEEVLLENTINSISTTAAPSDIAPADSNLAQNNQYEPETTPITLAKITELIEEKESRPAEEEDVEEVVPIHKTFTAPTQRLGASREEFSHMHPRIPSEGRVLRERKVTRTKKPSALLRSVLVVLGLVAIGVTVIGTGVAEPVLVKYGINAPQINYLVGQSSFTK